MAGLNMQLLDTTPKWLGLTLTCSACTLVVAGVGILVNQLVQVSITPFSLLLHFAVAISVSAWVLNLRIRMSSEKKPLLAIGIAVAIGSVWSSLQQWLGYLQTGMTSLGSWVIRWNPLMISFVTGPGFPSPIGTPWIRTTGTTSAIVPVRKISSALSNS